MGQRLPDRPANRRGNLHHAVVGGVLVGRANGGDLPPCRCTRDRILRDVLARVDGVRRTGWQDLHAAPRRVRRNRDRRCAGRAGFRRPGSDAVLRRESDQGAASGARSETATTHGARASRGFARSGSFSSTSPPASLPATSCGARAASEGAWVSSSPSACSACSSASIATCSSEWWAGLRSQGSWPPAEGDLQRWLQSSSCWHLPRSRSHGSHRSSRELDRVTGAQHHSRVRARGLGDGFRAREREQRRTRGSLEVADRRARMGGSVRDHQSQLRRRGVPNREAGSSSTTSTSVYGCGPGW